MIPNSSCFFKVLCCLLGKSLESYSFDYSERLINPNLISKLVFNDDIAPGNWLGVEIVFLLKSIKCVYFLFWVSTNTHFNSQESLFLPPNRYISLKSSFREYNIISSDYFTADVHMGTGATAIQSLNSLRVRDGTFLHEIKLKVEAMVSKS